MAWMDWLPHVVALGVAAMAFPSGMLIERSKRVHARRTEAYAEYLSALTRSVTLGDRHKVLADATLAKCKIVIYGSSEVIEALKAFEQAGASAGTEAGQEALLSLVAAMRGNKKVSREAIACLLLGGSVTSAPK